MKPMDKLKQYIDKEMDILEAELANHKFINDGLPVAFHVVEPVNEKEAVLSKLKDVLVEMQEICNEITKE